MHKSHSFWGIFWKIALLLALPCWISSTTRFGVWFFGALAAGGFVMDRCRHAVGRLPRFIYRAGRFVFSLWLVTFLAAEVLIIAGSVSQDIPPDTDYLLV